MRTMLHRTKLQVGDFEVWAALIDREDGWFLATVEPGEPGDEGLRTLHERPEEVFDEISRVVDVALKRGDTIYLEKRGEDEFERRDLAGRTTGLQAEGAPSGDIWSRHQVDAMLDSWARRPEPDRGEPGGPAEPRPAAVAPSLKPGVEYHGSVLASLRVRDWVQPEAGNGPASPPQELRAVHYYVRSFVPEGAEQHDRPVVAFISDLPQNLPGDFDVAARNIGDAILTDFGLKAFPPPDKTLFVLHYPRDIHGGDTPERFVCIEFGYDPTREGESRSPRTQRRAEMRMSEVLDLLGPENFAELYKASPQHSLARAAFEHGLGASKGLVNDPDPDLDR